MEALKKIATFCEEAKCLLIVFDFKWQETPLENTLLEDVK